MAKIVDLFNCHCSMCKSSLQRYFKVVFWSLIVPRANV